MKVKAYIQVSKDGRVTINKQPRIEPIHNQYTGRFRKYYPTVQFAVNFDIPDESFKLAEYDLGLELSKIESLKQINIEKTEIIEPNDKTNTNKD